MAQAQPVRTDGKRHIAFGMVGRGFNSGLDHDLLDARTYIRAEVSRSDVGNMMRVAPPEY